MTWRVSRVNIGGVKGVLDRGGDFDLGIGKSIAVYAPNGCGKSGYADAVEYILSPDGVVEHLGKGGADSERGGKHAIPHVLAKDRGLPSRVSLTLRDADSGRIIQATREVKTGRSDPIPAELEPIICAAPAHRVLRQHDLRRFVVDMEPRQKYSELSRWLGLERLEQVLAHLTTTGRALEETNPDREMAERLQDISKNTDGAVTREDQAATLTWCTLEAKKLLDIDVSISKVDDLEQCIQSLTEHRDRLVTRAGKADEVYKAKVAVERITDDLGAPGGQLEACDKALGEAIAAEGKVQRVEAQARDSIFLAVWESAKRLLETETTDHCPVCFTPWEMTHVKCQEAGVLQMVKGLEGLGELTKAQAALKQAKARLITSTKHLLSQLQGTEKAAEQLSLPNIQLESKNLADAIEALSLPDRTPSDARTECETALGRARTLVEKELSVVLPTLVTKGMPVAAMDADNMIQRMRILKNALVRLAELHRESLEYRQIERSFSQVARAIQKRAASLVNDVVDALRLDVESIYRKIHPTDAVPSVQIVPDTTSKTLLVRVGFHSSDRTVPPAGYLSESQVNTLGLVLFISSVRLFNREFPFVFLDDIVSSYDADHRARIVDVIAEDLDGFQVFLTTHDERFYSMLRDRLGKKGWQFDRIMAWAFDEGPKRESDVLALDQINQLIEQGNAEIAGNAMRQYMEEWLDKMCSRYGAYTLHKRGHKDFDRTLFDFWEPFVDRLKKIRGDFFKKCVEPQTCFKRLSNHALLNYYSHWQANPYEWSAAGDVKHVLDEFLDFQNLFRCFSCKKVLKYDHDEKKLYCTCGGQILASSNDGGSAQTP